MVTREEEMQKISPGASGSAPNYKMKSLESSRY